MTRSVLITGGNRGIGLAIATAFRAAGDKVAVTYRSGEPPAGFFGVPCDVTDTESVNRAFEAVASQQGPVEVLVANAGITRDNLFLTMPEQDFHDVIDTNFLGAVRAARAAVPDMVRARWGRIVLVGSTSGMWGGPGVSNYAASKSALVGFARSLAWELGRRKITVNVVAPGLIETDMVADLDDAARSHILGNTAMRRPGRPEEVATVVQFLAGEGASYVTGALLPVSGGNAMGH